MTSRLSDPEISADFSRDIASVVTDLRRNVAAAIEVVCGGSSRAQDVTDSFGIHRKLGWQLWNVAFADDPMSAVKFLPNARGLDVWIKSARLRGVSKELLDKVTETVSQFHQLIATHAEDREMLEMLVEARGNGPPDEDTEARWRKQAFTGNSYIFGVRAKRLLATIILAPSARTPYFDMVRIQGLIGLVRTRSNVRWPFSQSVVQTDDGVQRAPNRTALLDSPAVRQLGVPIMERFCSQPLPPVQRRLGEQGMLEDELLPGPVGQTGASTVITGEILREVAPAHQTTPGETALFGTGVRTPGELLITDHFVHRDLFPGARRELCVFGELISPTTQDARDLLPVGDRLQQLGRGLDRVRTADIPDYGDILETVFQQTGWNAKDFEVYRVRMRYPPIPASVMLRHDLPPAP
ncbi:MAG: hypothetical protein H7Z14_11080 [Anaerolineae bacterium]|nr:hypothetical protein [Phycisphaerae bacterium]